jgi:hypothetical protein
MCIMVRRRVFLSTLAAMPALLALPLLADPPDSVLYRVRNDGPRPMHVVFDSRFDALDLPPGQEFWTQRAAIEIDGRLHQLPRVP